MARVVELLGDRYELEELIGSGGMGEVFRARDLLLDRVVAVKRPSASFTGSSRERFRREARAAARLNHPHVVAVYDWGEDGESSYIVMEHVEGRSLRAVLGEQGPLQSIEVARVGAQIADALAHAHSKGIVHRDVKPSNVLLTTTGSVKVTDFGIAHSAATEALTEPGVVIGTAGYLAPEQVAGLAADARSDIYSLGVVLTELLTGAREHAAEAPTDEDGGAPRDPELLQIVAKARAEEPSERYERATELREALRVCARTTDGVPAVDPAHVVGEPVTGVVIDVPTATVAPLAVTVADPTKVLPAPIPPARAPAPAPDLPAPARAPDPPAPARAPVIAPAPAVVARPANATVDPPTSAVAAVAGSAAAAGATAPIAPPVAPPGRRARRKEARRARKAAKQATASKPLPKAKRAKRERRWRLPHVAWLVAAPVGVALVAAGVLAYRAITDVPDVTVPSVVGVYVFQGVDTLKQAGFEFEQVSAPSPQPAGTILALKPREGKRVPEGSTILVTISSDRAEMPDVIDIDEDSATAALRDVGLVNVTVNDDFRSDKEPGTVTASDPIAHQNALKADTITLSVARDPSVEIPSGIVGVDEATARTRLESIGLVAVSKTASSRSAPAGTVLSVSPGEGRGATRGDTVTITVSSGPRPVTLDDHVGDDADDASDDLTDDGFHVVITITPVTGSSQDGEVLAQSPGAGTQAPEGSTVTLTVGVRSR